MVGRGTAQAIALCQLSYMHPKVHNGSRTRNHAFHRGKPGQAAQPNDEKERRTGEWATVLGTGDLDHLSTRPEGRDGIRTRDIQRWITIVLQFDEGNTGRGNACGMFISSENPAASAR